MAANIIELGTQDSYRFDRRDDGIPFSPTGLPFHHIEVWQGLPYAPKGEDLREIMADIQPENKKILATAAYGYPFAFLANCAQEVVGFDISRNQIARNAFLAAGIGRLTWKENFDLLQGRMSIDEAKKKLSPAIPSELQPHAFHSLQRERGSTLHKGLTETDRLKDIFPHLENEEVFGKVRGAIEENRLTLVRGEFLAVLKMLIENGEQFDAVFGSNIRDVVLYFVFGAEDKLPADQKKATAAKFDEKYDQPLAQALHTILRQGGIFYDAIQLKHHRVPVVHPIDPEIYQGFDIGHHPSVVSPRRTKVYIARKI